MLHSCHNFPAGSRQAIRLLEAPASVKQVYLERGYQN